jgi:hypothetical protein
VPLTAHLIALQIGLLQELVLALVVELCMHQPAVNKQAAVRGQENT